MQADYTKQLTDIITALNRPMMPGWQIALLGALVGVIGSGLVQVLLRSIDERRERGRLRRIVYCELAEIFNRRYLAWADYLMERVDFYRRQEEDLSARATRRAAT